MNTDACLDNPYNPECQDQGNGGGTGDTTGSTTCPPGQTYSSGQCRPDCPPGFAHNGSGQCVEVFPGDDDPNTNGCGPNQQWSESQGRCVPKTTGSGGSSGGGGSSVPASLPTNLNPNWDSDYLNSQYGSMFSDLIADTNKLQPRWNPNNVAMVKGNLKASTAGEAKRQKDALIAHRSAMGTLKSGSTDRALRGIQETQGGKYTSGATGIDIQSVGENFNDQISIIEQKRAAIQQQASWLLALASNDNARAQIRNSLSIALLQLKQQESALKQQYQLSMAGLGVGLFGGAA